MKKLTLLFILALVFILGAIKFSYAQATDIGDLVDNFQKATDLQKTQILKDNLTKDIAAAGVVSNVGEYDFFDIVNDIKGTYYQVSCEQQKTKNNTPYQVIFLFKDKDKVADIQKGQNFQQTGKIVRINDERLQIAVWLLCADITDNDKLLFK